MRGIIYHDEIEQNTPEWFAIKKQFPYSGSVAYDFMRGKPVVKDETKPAFRGNKWTNRGHRLEPIARSLASAVRDMPIFETGFVTNEKYPMCGASPDGYTDVYLVEIKCFGMENHLKSIKDIPATIIAQVHWNCMIMNKKKYMLVFYCPDKRLDVKDRLVIIEDDVNPQIIKNMQRKAKEIVKS